MSPQKYTNFYFTASANKIFKCLFLYKTNCFPTQSVTIKVREHKLTPEQQIPQKKK